MTCSDPILLPGRCCKVCPGSEDQSKFFSKTKEKNVLIFHFKITCLIFLTKKLNYKFMELKVETDMELRLCNLLESYTFLFKKYLQLPIFYSKPAVYCTNIAYKTGYAAI